MTCQTPSSNIKVRNGASCVPDIVQMMARKLIMRATPSGKSVIFWIPHATSFGWNFGLVMAATGMVMMTMARQMMLTIVPTELNLAIQSVGILLKHACDSIMRVVRRYVCQSVGMYSGCIIEAVAKIMEASEGVSLSILKCFSIITYHTHSLHLVLQLLARASCSSQ